MWQAGGVLFLDKKIKKMSVKKNKLRPTCRQGLVMQNAVMVPHECLKMLWLWNVVIENNHHCSWKGELLAYEEKILVI